MNDLPIIIILLPLISALLSIALSRIHIHLGRNIVTAAIFVALGCAVKLFINIIKGGPVHYSFGGYKAPYCIEF